jgi:D-sedoheptulose 7-phosphate isomerase
MTGTQRRAVTAADARELFSRRAGAASEVAEQAAAVAGACHAMALRFHQGGRLVVFGTGGASTDAQHVAVEFVHPVIVGKRALPAISLTTDVATVTGIAEREGVRQIFAHQLRYLAAPADIALGISADGNCASVLGGLATARELGLGAGARVLGAAWRAGTGSGGINLPAAGDGAGVIGGGTGRAAPRCYGDVCITCSDTAVEVTVVRLLPDGLAVVDTGAGEEEVSVALVTARPGDRLLVHAGEAIGVVGR